jgi:hypothetical protein
MAFHINGVTFLSLGNLGTKILKKGRSSHLLANATLMKLIQL